MKKLLQRRRRGAAVPLAMIAVMILLAMGAGLLSLGMNVRIFSIRTCSAISARSAADSGLTMAVFEMNEKLKVKPWDDSTLPQATNETLPNFDATFSYAVTDNLDGSYSVDVTGRYGQSLKRVGSTLFRTSIFQRALLIQGAIMMESEYLVDAYNSNDGPYGGANALQSTSIATNSTSSGAVQMDGSGTLYGNVVTSAGVDMSQVLPPTSPPFDVSQGEITSSTTINQDGQYDKIDLENETLTISGDVTLYVPGKVKFERSNLEILPGSSLTLYVGAEFEVEHSPAQINNVTKKPESLLIYGVGSGEFKFEHDVVFYGVIYAPDYEVEMEHDVDLYGAIVADSAKFENSVSLHYDMALAEANLGDLGDEFAMKQWWEE